MVRRVESPRDYGGIDIDQLALALVEKMRGPEPERPMLGELAETWLAHIAPRRVAPDNERRLVAHLRPLFLEDEASLTVGAVVALLDSLERGGLSPVTVNKVRACGKHLIEHAQAHRRWSGPNPFALARRKREPLRKYELLTLDELARVEKKLAPELRRLFRVALHLGLRTGELFALRREDVDFDAGTVRVHRSHGRDQTKTGPERLLPIHPACAGELLEASLLAPSPSSILFPASTGERRRADTKLTRALRTAMAAAGVGVVAVTYKCRRRWCDAPPERHEESTVRRLSCARCGMRLWAVPEVRRVRWYDLRHMCATFHHQAGADEVCVALALGHSLHGTTHSVYTHPSLDTMRRELHRWRVM